MSSNRYEISRSSSSVSNEIMKIIQKAEIQYIGEALYENDWKSITHYHACTELFYCLSGTGRLAVKNKILSISSNDLVLVPPHIDHTEYGTSGEPMRYIVLGISNFDFPFTTETDYTLLQCNAIKKHILPILYMLVQHGRENSTCCVEVCQKLLEILLVQTFCILPSTQNKKINTSSPDSTVEQLHCSTKECAAAYRYINEHFNEEITLDSLSELAHINKYYLSHSFKSIYGISPIRYLLERRIDESKCLLKNTNHSLIQIAEMTGFSSSSYFSQSFRRVTKQTPSQYRLSNTNGSMPKTLKNNFV